jgi:hypothetical protein
MATSSGAKIALSVDPGELIFTNSAVSIVIRRILLDIDIFDLNNIIIFMIQTLYKKERRFKEAKRPYRTKEGEKVYSRGELEIANFLHDNGIGYHYEPSRIIDGREWVPDFYLYALDVYIEFQGMVSLEKSRKRYAARYMAFKNHGELVIYLYPSELGRLGAALCYKYEQLKHLSLIAYD